jgi:hypothetical protein
LTSAADQGIGLHRRGGVDLYYTTWVSRPRYGQYERGVHHNIRPRPRELCRICKWTCRIKNAATWKTLLSLSTTPCHSTGPFSLEEPECSRSLARICMFPLSHVVYGRLLGCTTTPAQEPASQLCTSFFNTLRMSLCSASPDNTSTLISLETLAPSRQAYALDRPMHATFAYEINRTFLRPPSQTPESASAPTKS